MSELGGRGLDIATDADTLNGRLLVVCGEPAYCSAKIDSFKNRPGNPVYELYAELQSRGYETEFVLPRMDGGETDDYAVDAFALDSEQASMIKEVVDKAVISKPAEAYEDIEIGNVLRWYHVISSPLYRDKKAHELSLETEEAVRFLPRIYMSTYDKGMALRSDVIRLERATGKVFSGSKKYSKARWLSYDHLYNRLKNAGYEPLSVDEQQSLIAKAIDQALQETGIPLNPEDDETVN